VLTDLLPAVPGLSSQGHCSHCSCLLKGGRRESISKGDDGSTSWTQLDEAHNASGGSCQALPPCRHPQLRAGQGSPQGVGTAGHRPRRASLHRGKAQEWLVTDFKGPSKRANHNRSRPHPVKKIRLQDPFQTRSSNTCSFSLREGPCRFSLPSAGHSLTRLRRHLLERLLQKPDLSASR